MTAVSNAQALVDALGGRVNITEIEPCMMRVRVTVADLAIVDEAAIRATSPVALVFSGRYIQIVLGQAADEVAAAMSRIIGNLSAAARG